MLQDVAESVQAIGAAVRKGDFAEATAIAGRSALPLGVTAQQLQLGNLISSGAESSVYHGTYLGTRVAVKRPRIGTASDLDRFRRELCILASLQHDSIIPVLAAKALPPDYSLVLPWYPKVASEQLHQHGWRPSWHAILSLATQLASAVAHVHKHGVVHRDIKAGNLMLAEDAQHCVLIDFGIAAYAAELDADLSARTTTHVGSKPSGGFHKAHMVGTLEYMAPEVLQRRPHSTCSDVFALATTINELATAIVPYSDCTRDNPKAHTILDMGYGRQELAAAVCAEGLRPLPRDDTPPPLLALLEACWLEEPTARPTAAQVAAALASMQAQLAEPPAPLMPSTGSALVNGHRTNVGCGDDAPAGAEWSNTVLPDGSGGRHVVVDSFDSSAANLSIPWPREAAYQPKVCVGVFATAGRRGADKMEDTVVAASPLVASAPHVHLLAVFDGHRGDAMARHAEAHLATAVCTAAAAGANPADALTRAFEGMDRHFRAHEVCFVLLHYMLRTYMLRNQRAAAVEVTSTCHRINGGRSTLQLCTVPLVCEPGQAVAVSRDHTAALEDERKRVEAAGAAVRWAVDGWRMGPAGLQVTRSLGDGDLKGCGVIATPEVIETPLTKADEFVVLGSDGLWDKVSNQEVVDLVHDTVKQPAMCAQRLVTEALARGGEDNVAVVVAFLRPVETTERIYAGGRQKYHAHAESYVSTRRAGMRYAASGSMDEQLDTY